MDDLCIDEGAARATGKAHSTTRRPGAAAWLHLAATPTFAAMTLLAAITPATGMDVLCGTAHGTVALGGTTLMYGLMGAFHAGPWLKLLAARRRGS